MRDLNLAIVAHQMMRGARSIYVDFVDYDEVAHHAGGTPARVARGPRPDSTRRSPCWRRSPHERPRRYHFVVLSDHGQSQGAPFADRYGTSLGDLCSDLTSQDVLSLEENVESWGRAESLLDDLSGDHGVARADREPGRRPAPVALERGHGRGRRRTTWWCSGPGTSAWSTHPRTSASCSRTSRDGGHGCSPAWRPTPGSGSSPCSAASTGRVVIGADGYRRLRADEVSGVDPLRDFAPHAARVLLRAVEMPRSPDIYVNSTVDTSIAGDLGLRGPGRRARRSRRVAGPGDLRRADRPRRARPRDPRCGAAARGAGLHPRTAGAPHRPPRRRCGHGASVGTLRSPPPSCVRRLPHLHERGCGRERTGHQRLALAEHRREPQHLRRHEAEQLLELGQVSGEFIRISARLSHCASTDWLDPRRPLGAEEAARCRTCDPRSRSARDGRWSPGPSGPPGRPGRRCAPRR